MNIYSPIGENFRLTGRVDRSDGACLTWPGTSIYFRFRGSSVKIAWNNENFGADTILGAVVDKEEKQYFIGGSGSGETIIAEGLEDKEHDIIIYKRMEGHFITIKSVTVDGEILPLPKAPKKRIEVYGDSVSAGSVVDCEEYAGKSDPEHHGQWDNSWHAYPQIIARELPAEVYDTSQGGISIFDGTGWFEMPDTKGMESCWDKCRYSSYRPKSEWDFHFVPHVIIFAIGQNDSNPDPDILLKPDKKEKWLKKYIEIINSVRAHSPKAAVVLALTVLNHDPIWDDAMEEIKERLGGERKNIYHFMYSRVGRATPGHPRYSEQKEMAAEMKNFLNSLPNEIWED